MTSPLEDVLNRVGEKIIAYMPNLVAGVVLIIIGWIVGWMVKRIVIQLLAVLRFDRLLRRFRWGTDLAKADVRYALFDFIGNAAFLVIFLILLNASFDALQLTVLSNLLEKGVLFIPKLAIALVVAGLGWILASWIAGIIQKALVKEDIPRATLIARFAKAVLMLFFSAMALTELDIAKEIVVIGFGVTIVTLGVLTIVLTSLGGKKFVSKLLESLEE
jgi:Mechanosensitive ion channel, conserved TM helix